MSLVQIDVLFLYPEAIHCALDAFQQPSARHRLLMLVSDNNGVRYCDTTRCAVSLFTAQLSRRYTHFDYLGEMVRRACVSVTYSLISRLHSTSLKVAVWRSNSTLVSMNEVTYIRRARLVLRWATVFVFNSRCRTFI